MGEALNYANLKRLSLDELVEAGSSPHIGFRFYQAILQELDRRTAYNSITDLKYLRGARIAHLQKEAKPAFSFTAKPLEAVE